MATNDNRAMVEAAREFCFKEFASVAPIEHKSIDKLLATFAIEQVALAVAAERTRMIDDNEKLQEENRRLLLENIRLRGGNA